MIRHSIVAVAVLAAATVAGAQKPKSTTSFTGNLGYVSATGNTRLSTLNVGDKLVHTNGPWTFTQTAAYVNGTTKGVETANQFQIAGRVDYAFRPRLGLFAGASYDRNPFAGFKFRTNELLGLRWNAVVAPHDSLDLDAGGALTQQRDVSDSNETFPAARLAANYRHHFSKAAYFQQTVEYLPDLKTSGAYRLNTESAVVAPVSSHIGIKVSYQVQYNSNPPQSFGTTDRLLTTGVQVTF